MSAKVERSGSVDQRQPESDVFQSKPQRDGIARLKGVASFLCLVAVFAVVIAVAVNWGAYRSAHAESHARVPGGSSGEGLRVEDLPRAPIDMLPETVLTYETIARQPVPGKSGLEAEAIYVTLNMDIEIQVPITVYARVRAYGDAASAQAALDEEMRAYPRGARTADMGYGTLASVGQDAQETAWVAAWTEGQYFVFVKSTFRDKAPFEKRQFLQSLGTPVAKAVARYISTGKQGAQQ